MTHDYKGKSAVGTSVVESTEFGEGAYPEQLIKTKIIPARCNGEETLAAIISGLKVPMGLIAFPRGPL